MTSWGWVILDNYLSYTLQVLVSIYLIRVKDTGSGALNGEIYKTDRKTSKQ